MFQCLLEQGNDFFMIVEQGSTFLLLSGFSKEDARGLAGGLGLKTVLLCYSSLQFCFSRDSYMIRIFFSPFLLSILLELIRRNEKLP